MPRAHVIAATLLVGCDAATAPVDPIVDASSADSVGDVAKACSMLEPGAPVAVEAVAKNPIALTSAGTIIAGTYRATEAIDYTGVGGFSGPRGTMRRTMLFTATTYETSRRDNDGPIETFAGTWVYGKSGTGLPTWQPTDTCPGTTATTYGAVYEATPTTIKMYVSNGIEGHVRLVTMTKI